MKVTIELKGFIAIDRFSGKFAYRSIEMDEYGDVTVCPVQHSFEVDIPDDFNPIVAKVSAIDKKISKVQADSDLIVRRLKDEKAKLLCIENGVHV